MKSRDSTETSATEPEARTPAAARSRLKPSSNPAGKRERNKLANRAAILEAARKCFLKMGYDAVTIRDVVRKTGLAAGTFYNYFTDKDVLFKAVLEARIQEVNETMHAARIRAVTVEDFIHAAYSALFAKVHADPSFFQLIMRNEHAVRSAFEDSVIGIPMRQLKADLHEFIARGVFPPLDVELLAAAFYGVGFEIARIVAFDPKADVEATARFATQLMTAGVKGFGLSKASLARTRKGEVAVRGSLP